LYQPAQNYLSNAFPMFLGERKQQFVLEDVVLTFCKLRPCSHLNIVFFQEFLGFNLLTERMCLNLIPRRNHFVMHDQVHNPIRLKVGNANCSNPSFPIQFFHGSPGTIDIPEGLMNQIQIEI
jgi:hypothetical protein